MHGYLNYAYTVLFVCQDMVFDKLYSLYVRFYIHPLKPRTKGYTKELPELSKSCTQKLEGLLFWMKGTS